MAQSLNISDIQLFNLLKPKLGEKEAEQFVLFVKEELEKMVEEKKEIISKEIIVLRDEVKKKFKYLREEITKVFATKEDLHRLEIKLSQIESKLILWAFVFWATQLGAIFAFLKILIK